jgi:hypothetical protein
MRSHCTCCTASNLNILRLIFFFFLPFVCISSCIIRSHFCKYKPDFFLYCLIKILSMGPFQFSKYYQWDPFQFNFIDLLLIRILLRNKIDISDMYLHAATKKFFVMKIGSQRIFFFLMIS